MHINNMNIGKHASKGGKAILEKYGKEYFKKLNRKSVKKRRELSKALTK